MCRKWSICLTVNRKNKDEKLLYKIMKRKHTDQIAYTNALGGCPASSINKLQVDQIAAARVLTRS